MRTISIQIIVLFVIHTSAKFLHGRNFIIAEWTTSVRVPLKKLTWSKGPIIIFSFRNRDIQSLLAVLNEREDEYGCVRWHKINFHKNVETFLPLPQSDKRYRADLLLQKKELKFEIKVLKEENKWKTGNIER